MIGGLITGLIAILGVVLERRHAHLLRQKDKLQADAALAFSIQIKISRTYGWARSTKNAIDECFANAEVEGVTGMDPGVKVSPLVGNKAPDWQFSSSELALLLSTGDRGLVESLLSFQWQFGTTVALVDAFNQARLEYSRFVSSASIDGEFIEGTIASVSLPIKMKHAAEARVAELNQLVSEMIEGLPNVMDKAEKSVSRVESALRSLEGLKVVSVGFEP